MEYDLYGALKAGVSPADIQETLRTKGVGYDVQGALKAGVNPLDIDQHINQKLNPSLVDKYKNEVSGVWNQGIANSASFYSKMPTTNPLDAEHLSKVASEYQNRANATKPDNNNYKALPLQPNGIGESIGLGLASSPAMVSDLPAMMAGTVTGGVAGKVIGAGASALAKYAPNVARYLESAVVGAGANTGFVASQNANNIDNQHQDLGEASLMGAGFGVAFRGVADVGSKVLDNIRLRSRLAEQNNIKQQQEQILSRANAFNPSEVDLRSEATFNPNEQSVSPLLKQSDEIRDTNYEQRATNEAEATKEARQNGMQSLADILEKRKYEQATDPESNRGLTPLEELQQQAKFTDPSEIQGKANEALQEGWSNKFGKDAKEIGDLLNENDVQEMKSNHLLEKGYNENSTAFRKWMDDTSTPWKDIPKREDAINSLANKAIDRQLDTMGKVESDLYNQKEADNIPREPISPNKQFKEAMNQNRLQEEGAITELAKQVEQIKSDTQQARVEGGNKPFSSERLNDIVKKNLSKTNNVSDIQSAIEHNDMIQNQTKNRLQNEVPTAIKEAMNHRDAKVYSEADVILGSENTNAMIDTLYKDNIMSKLRDIGCGL